MKFNFRQGIQHAPLTSNSPDYLIYNPGGDTVEIAVGVDLVRVTGAFRAVNYLHEEREDSISAWGQFTWNALWGADPLVYRYYLYWDWNLSTGRVTRSYTPWEPVATTSPPPIPARDQHWYDTVNNVQKYWDGSTWRECIRVFAGWWDTGLQTVEEYELGTQVGAYEPSDDHDLWFDHGYILFGVDMKGVKYADGTFFTTATQAYTFHGSFSSPIRLELANSTALAAEPIPAFYCVTNIGDGTIQLASGQNIDKRPIGIVLTDANPGDAVDVITKGFVWNDQWNWSAALLGKDLYSGPTGELTQTESGARIGTIISPQSIIVEACCGGSGESGPDIDDASTTTYHFADPDLDLGFPTVEAALDYLLFSPLSVSISGGSLNEVGSTVTTVNCAWSYNDTPELIGPYPILLTQALTDFPGLLLADRSHLFTGLSITTNKSYTITATDARSTISASTTVAFSLKRYWGASALTSLSDADIRAMSQEFAGSEPKTVIYNCSGGKYPYYIYPASWGVPVTVLVGGFFYSDYSVTTRNFTNASGHTEPFNIIKFNGIQTASILNVVWN